VHPSTHDRFLGTRCPATLQRPHSKDMILMTTAIL
jgi:hypothetical protein